MRTRTGLVGVGVVVALLGAGCSTGSRTVAPGAKIAVVAVENIVSSPATAPHDYEPTAADVRAIASANFVILNGLGYDHWARAAVDANPNPARRVLDVGATLGLRDGDNPHRWYFRDDVAAV